MYQFFVEPGQIDVTAKSVIIRGNDVNHIKNVLRMRPEVLCLFHSLCQFVGHQLQIHF